MTNDDWNSLVVTVNYYEVKKGGKLEHSAPDLKVKDKPQPWFPL